MIDTVLRQSLKDPASARPRPTSQRGLWRLGIALIDAAQVPACGLALALLPPLAGTFRGTAELLGIGVLVAVLSLLIRRSLRPAWPRPWLPRISPAMNASLAVLLAFLLVTAAMHLAQPDLAAANHLLVWMSAWAGLAALCSAALRLALTPVAGAAPGRGHRIVVLGPDHAAQALRRLAAGSLAEDQVIAHLRHDDPQALRQIERLVAEQAVDTVLLSGLDARETRHVCRHLDDFPVNICIGFDAALLEETALGQPRLQRLPLVPLIPNPAIDWAYVCKRWMDIGVILLLLPIIAPVLIAAAIAIRIESPGPILFRQWRFGLSSTPTQIFKFRTMYHDRGDASGEQRTLARDPRVTRVGRILRRTSIDELPQLLNVLRGDMSLVGPRPHATHMKVEGNYYFEAVEHYRLRHRVLPGLTGWAQVNGSRGEVDTLEKARRRLELDLWYIENWSLMLDLRIQLRTLLGGFMTPRAD